MPFAFFHIPAKKGGFGINTEWSPGNMTTWGIKANLKHNANSYKERWKEMQLTSVEERKEEDTIYKLINQL